MAARHFSEWSREAKVAYAAGIMDGEGSISILRTPGNIGFRLYIQIGQTEKGWHLLEFLRDEFGAGVSNPYQPPGNRVLSRLAYWSGDDAVEFILAVQHRLLIKDAQAALALEFHEWLEELASLSKVYNRDKWDYNARAIGERFYNQMKELNKRGK